jgi:hypothetical protein
VIVGGKKAEQMPTFIFLQISNKVKGFCKIYWELWALSGSLRLRILAAIGDFRRLSAWLEVFGRPITR